MEEQVKEQSLGTMATKDQRALLGKYLHAQLIKSRKEAEIVPHPEGQLVPLSHQQQQIWLHAQLVGDAPLYNETITIYRQGELDLAVLERCLVEIVRRHEIWRTTFRVMDNEPVQIAHPAPEKFPIKVVDLRMFPACERDREAKRLAVEDVGRSFDLRTGPLLRGLLITMDDHEHRLYMTFHHLVFDAVTAYQVFIPELERLYEAFSFGKPSPLVDLSLQYSDFAYWQQKEVSTRSEDLGYWRRQLDGILPCSCPTDRPRPSVETHRGEVRRFVFPEKLSQQIRNLSRSSGASVYTILLTGLIAVLHRYTNQNDIVLGTLTSGRNRTDLENMMGCFLNPLALRIDVSGNPSFAELQKRAQNVVLEALTHDRVPFVQVVKEVKAGNDPSRNPIFQVILSQQPAMLHATQGWEVVSEEISNGASKLDLLIVVDDRGGAISGPITFNPDLFDPATIGRLVGHWQVLLGTGIGSLDREISQIPLLTGEEKGLLEHWNDTTHFFPNADQCLHQLVESQCELNAHSVALIFEKETLTYGELNQRANQLAWNLRKLGVGPNVLVGILADRSFEMVIALLGVLKAGGAYVPIDPEYPADRIDFMLQDAGPPVLLSQSHLANRVSKFKGRILLLDRDWVQISSNEISNLPNTTTPDDLAYMIYTSGSTGKPKGAMNTHRGICNRLLWMQDQYGLTGADTILQKTLFSFDVSVWEFFWPLLVGAPLVLARPGGHREPAYLVDLIREQKITVLHFVPSMLGIFLGQPGVEHCLSLRHVICSGEALPFHLQEQFFKLLPAQLHNLYGPTEAAVDVTHWTCQRDSERKFVPIGRPVANTKVYVLDGNMQPVPIGVPGELYIGGVQVGRGYHNRPELTAERFLPDAFSGEPEARLYKTGDLCRWLEDGTLEYLGRTDFQVKIRGQRIELGEIEAVLSTHHGIKQCVVVVRENTLEDPMLVAYFEPQEGCVPNVGDMRALLKKQLPDYMVPTAYVPLEAMPLTPNGKVDRKALPAPEAEAYGPRRYEEPEGETETMLAAIWAEVLKVERVGRQDNFFELGGHSLVAVRLIERMRQKGLHADVRSLFITPTLAELAAIVSPHGVTIDVPPNRIAEGCTAITPEMLPLVNLRQQEIERIVSRVPGGATNVQDIYPLAPLQEGILFHHLMGGEGDPYVVVVEVSFDSRRRLDAYLGALQAAIDRHDILRTAVMWEGLPEPVQVVCRKVVLAIEEVELDPAAGDVAKQLFERFNLRRYRMDLRQAPLLRVYIAWDEPNKRWLTMELLHQFWSDISSVDVLEAEIEAHLLGQAGRLPAPVPYRNLIAQARLGVSREEHEAFFRQLLGDVDEPTAPFGLLNVQGDGNGVEGAHVALDSELSRRIRVCARNLRVSAASLCHVAWAQVLALVSGREDVVFGTVLLGRMEGGEANDRMMGLFINTLPFRIHIGDESAEASVLSTHRLLASLLRHEHASLVLAQRCSAVPARTPLFSALLNYRHGRGMVEARWEKKKRIWESTPWNASVARSEEKKRAWEGIEVLSEEDRTNYPFVLSVDDLGERFELTTQTEAPIEPMRVCEYMRTALESLVDALENAPATAVRDLEVLGHSEREQVLHAWNGTKKSYPAACLHHLLELEVERNPEAVAVVFEDLQLSYRELNNRANQLAWHLRKLGVGPDVRVGLLVERSLEMVTALLGILKAGGAYVPIEPDYPPDRVAFILEDASPLVLVSQARFLGRLPSHGGKTICLDSDWDQISREDTSNPPQTTTPDNLAYVIYTSGTTGRPKGALITHRNVVRLFAATEQWYGFNERDVWTLFHSCAFDFSVWEIWGALLYGGRLVVVPFILSRSPQAFYELLAKEQVTVLNQTPSAFRQLIQAEESVGQKQLALRYVIFGGEALKMQSLRPWFERHGDQKPQLVNMYGITETTVHVTYRPISKGDLNSGSLIGVPIPDLQIYILDPQRRPVPIGVPGEMYVGGAGLARGYLNRPDLTAERFIPDRLTGQPGARLYKTGDLCRWLPDGSIEYLGRTDSQVKIRGFRIELGEIEAVLARSEKVRQCVVAAREDSGGDKTLVAYLESHEGSMPDASELRAHLKKDLPDYMVPSAFVLVEKLPLTPNGKIDFKALPAPEQGRIEIKDRYVAPHDPIEQMLAQLWVKVLRVKRVGVHDNFFELGGHSLLAVRIVVEIEERFKKRLPLATMLQAPTVSELAEVLRKEQWKPLWESLVPVQPGGSKPPLFLMHSHGGNVLEYYSLASHLGADQPVYALQARGLDGRIPKNQSIEEMAASYLAEVRSLQPQGPYFLGGFCFGGLLALEAAQQLSAAGDEVALVVLIQTMHAGAFQFVRGTPHWRRRWNRTTKRIDLERENFLYRGVGYIGERGRRALDIVGARSAIAFDRTIGSRSDGRAHLSLPYILESLAVEHGKAYRRYVPRSYSGEVVIFRASKQLRGLVGSDPHLGWHDLLHSLEVCEVAGHQENILLEPHVSRLAEELRSRLQAVHERGMLAFEKSLAAVPA